MIDKHLTDFIKRISFKGPKCRICGEEWSPYDMSVCKKCQGSIDRLKK